MTRTRVCEKFTSTDATRLNANVAQRIIDMCIAEMTRSADHCAALQKPAVETLVAIGRQQCDTVMSALYAQLHSNGAAHFMVLTAMGMLSTANTAGIVPHLKPTLIAVLPTLGGIRADQVRKAYAAGKYENKQ